ncbi:MAG: hypothetical protein B7Z80_24690 [Rhodospirillales bacterium 20-64-7]|nr:MAG: hypothetical protein B7Z80_24690 [Rhodospirillales bacterium 20-64-7]
MQLQPSIVFLILSYRSIILLIVISIFVPNTTVFVFYSLAINNSLMIFRRVEVFSDEVATPLQTPLLFVEFI